MATELRIQGLSKSFYGVSVLQSIDLNLPAGQILGLVGENGAGKSTLMNIIGGHLIPDAGQMTLTETPYVPTSPREAMNFGIGLVHQELNLFPNLSVAENLFLTTAPNVAGWINRSQVNEKANELLQRVGLDCASSESVGNLSAGEQQLVEIARVIGMDSQILLLDEPTTSLSDREAKRFFDVIRQLAKSGRTIVLISHAIDDVLRHCDRVAVLRDGVLVADRATGETNANEVIHDMVGRPLNQLFPNREKAISTNESQPILRVDQVYQPRVVNRVSIQVNKNEVVGLFGLMGAGRTELARIIAGLDPCASGEIHLCGKPLSGSIRKRIQLGLGYVTENRRTEGILANSSVFDNFILVSLKRLSHKFSGWIRTDQANAEIDSVRQEVRLQPHLDAAQSIKTLSGGNQQKVVIGKWLINSPNLLILDEPTRGIDVGSKLEIYRMIHDYTNSGNGVLAISSDIDELIGICDRIVVMSLGKVCGDFERHQFDRHAILESAFSEHRSPAIAEESS